MIGTKPALNWLTRAAQFKDTEVSKPHYYVRDDGQLMVEMRPGQFISKAAAVRLGLVGASVLEDIERTMAKPKWPSAPKRAKAKRPL